MIVQASWRRHREGVVMNSMISQLREPSAHRRRILAFAGHWRRMCFTGLAALALPSCIVLNAGSHWHAEQIVASHFGALQDKPGFGLVAAYTDWPVYLEDFDPVARHASRWCRSYRGAVIGAAIDPTKPLHQSLAVIRVPAGDYAVSTQQFSYDSHGPPGETWWIQVPDMSRIDLGGFVMAVDHDAKVARLIHANTTGEAARLGFSPASVTGLVTAEEARRPLCATF